MEKYLRVGVIANTHGVRGEVKIYATTDDIRRFKKLKECFIDTGKEKIPVEVESCKFFKEMPILKFRSMDQMGEVEGFKGKDLLVSREHAVKLKKNEFFIVDLVGLSVESDEGMPVGILTDVLQTGGMKCSFRILSSACRKAIRKPEKSWFIYCRDFWT